MKKEVATKEVAVMVTLTHIEDTHITLRVCAEGEGALPDAIRKRITWSIEFPQCAESPATPLTGYHHPPTNGTTSTSADDEMEYYREEYYRVMGNVD